MEPRGDAKRLSRPEQIEAIKTWRYLRLAMVALVVGLLVSIAYEWGEVNADCLQTSISAYYYTPVRGYFVGGLVSIGVCLFCLKGSTEPEDTLLNLAGMFALIVALVPTEGASSCASRLGTAADRDVNIANNVTALLAIGALGLVALAVMARRARPTPLELAGWGAAALVCVVTALSFWLDRSTFVDGAHYTAAVLMFLCIVAVVAINALGYKTERGAPPVRNPYVAVAAAMAVTTVVILATAAAGWDYWVIAIEGALISLFAVFWVIQTLELWHRGLR
jgi:hypothetical protein